MGKIKSAVLTAILVAAIAVLAFFALFSWQVPGSNGVDRYNSFISSIRMGGDLTGEAYAELYPEGVITVSDYEFGKPEDADKLEEYKNKYERHGNVYIEKDALTDGVDSLKASVLADADVLNNRYAQKGYSAYSVSVQDEFTLKVTVPTNFTYSSYKRYDESARSNATSAISRTVQLLAYDGELTLRNSKVGESKFKDGYILTPIQKDIKDYFKSVGKYSMGGNHSVKVNLTKEGKERFKIISNLVMGAEDDKAIGFYVGDNKLLSLEVSEVMDRSSFYISVDEAYAQDYAVILNSVVHGETIELNYNASEAQIVYASAQLGDLAAPLLGVALLLVILGFIIYSVVKYKRLGLVNALMIVIFALTLITALMLLGIQLTIAGAVFAVLGLTLLCGSNFLLFEKVRKETKAGKIVQSAIKSGYRKLLTGILELHAVLIAAALLLAFVAVGELASCGLIFFISVTASYVLYWFTRFMWYVTSSPVRNKFAFCGFTREEQKNG